MAINLGGDKFKQMKALGRAKIALANKGTSMFGEKISNAKRLKLSQSGLKLLMQGTMQQNKAKKKKK